MIFDKATKKDIDVLTDLRIAYLNEDLGQIADADLELISSSLPSYYTKHLNKDFSPDAVYIAEILDLVASSLE